MAITEQTDTSPPMATNLIEAIPNKSIYRCDMFVAQHGLRKDDDAYVIHFFVPSYTYEKLRAGEITERFNQAAMQKVIEEAVSTILRPKRIQVVGQYSSILDSFYLSLLDMAMAPFPERLVELFLAEVERIARLVE